MTEENIEDFIRDASTNFPEKRVKIEELLRAVLECPEYTGLVDENVGMFENSVTWASENQKNLSFK